MVWARALDGILVCVHIRTDMCIYSQIRAYMHVVYVVYAWVVGVWCVCACAVLSVYAHVCGVCARVVVRG